MGFKLSRFTRIFRNYNVESRAFKVISKEKPTPAPRYPSTLKYEQELRAREPENEESYKALLENLKHVYVESKNSLNNPKNPHQATNTHDEDGSGRTLPQNKKYVAESDYGFLEPAVVPEGKVTLRQAVWFTYKHKENPDEWTAEVIAKDYKLDLGATQQILHYFKAHALYWPVQKQKTLAQKILKDLYIPGRQEEEEKK